MALDPGFRKASRPLPDEHAIVSLKFNFTASESVVLQEDRTLSDRAYVLWNAPWLDVYHHNGFLRDSAEVRLLKEYLRRPDVPPEFLYRIHLGSPTDHGVEVDHALANRAGKLATHVAEKDRETIWRILNHQILGVDGLGLDTQLNPDHWFLLTSSGIPTSPAAHWTSIIPLLRQTTGHILEHEPTAVRITAKDALARSSAPSTLRRPFCPDGHGHMASVIGSYGRFFRCRDRRCPRREDGGRCVL